MAVINLKNVYKVFGLGDATTVALDDISLTVEPGEFVAIMGPSGSGKSTLLNIIGLLDRPSQGIYSLDEKDVSRVRTGRRSRLRRDQIGFVFQAFNLLPRATVIDNVALPLAYKGLGQTRRLKRAEAMLDSVSLKTRQYYFPRQLSGGQMQRVAIARALINDPRIIIADEPTGNLDSASSEQIMELLKELNDSGRTILLVTHNPDLTAYASRVLYMRDGQIQYDRALKEHEVVDLDAIKAAKDYQEGVRKEIRKNKRRQHKKRKTS